VAGIPLIPLLHNLIPLLQKLIPLTPTLTVLILSECSVLPDAILAIVLITTGNTIPHLHFAFDHHTSAG
jgi:hypothetical protein